MKVGLFIPCYIDQFYPQVGIATLELLEKYGCEVDYPHEQTCCGQPMANAGCERDAEATYHHFVNIFHPYDYIVAPSGSCIYHIRKHYDTIEQTPEVINVRRNTLDLAEFLLDVLKVTQVDSSFPYKVGLHLSCHGLRGLRLGTGSERVVSQYSKLAQLLGMVRDVELVHLSHADECCGFGGTFAINEEAISVKMGQDRIKDHVSHGVDVISAGDSSCLMHLEGILRRQESGIQVRHIAEILNGTSL